MGYATNYNFASRTKEFKNKLDSYAHTSYNDYGETCKNIVSRYGIKESHDAAETCRKVMGYLKHVQQNGATTDSIDKCKYLYYWLHHDLLLHKTHHSSTLNLYKQLLEVYKGNDYYSHLCNYYIEDIDKIKLLNANKLIELYTIFRNEQRTPGKCYCSCASECYSLHKKYVVECNNQTDEDFCSELENFKYLYDRNMRSIGTCINAPKTLESVKPNVPSSPIVFPLMLALAMHSLLFILYKVNNAYYNTYM
ncbi:hypothetical protein PVMG_05823 [Plasmodium vivax Mauritania I]|uniref:VIR protein n=1 Tax=Plasmodium vivax Mauritania I TaxID=1035515 RepID=A0A0J9TK88_PLAVI|nr:hypothetical protein PVMG_05823 [Plasmodium vivax Mauritania I]